ncbi:hypothetical protein [Nonomuraea sp. NPDC003214]
MKLRHVIIASTLALPTALTLALTTAPAQAVTCVKGWGADLHSAWIDCDNGNTTGTFRLKVQVCASTGCAWRYGPWKYYQGGGASTYSDMGTWVNTSSITYEPGPAGGFAPSD